MNKKLISISLLSTTLLTGFLVGGMFRSTDQTVQAAGKTFYSSSVKDNLNPNDRKLFENKFKSIGYSKAGSNTNISSAALINVMGRSDITTFYHTGHGYDSGIATANDEGLSVDQVKTINNQNVIFGTCLTLTSTNWAYKMGPNCYNVLGYTNFSYDGVDDNVITSFAKLLKSGKSYIQAWYTSNIAESLVKDRWCGYVRESIGIVQYSARTGYTPASKSSSIQTVNSKGTLKVATALLTDTNKYDNYFCKIRNSEITVSGSTSQKATFRSAKSNDFLPKVAISEEKAVTAAQNCIAGSLPSDAKQEQTIQIVATDPSGNSKVVGQVIRYARYIDGLALRSNGKEDHIALLVDNDGVVASSKIWPTIQNKSKAGAISASQILSVAQAIEKASAKLNAIIKANSTLTIVDAKPCYGVKASGTVVPAYELIDSTGGSIIINAITGELVK